MATIAENLATLSTHLDDAYAAISALGGEIPQERRAGNLASSIAGIPQKMCGITVPRLKDAHDLGGMLSGNETVSSVSFPQLSSCERLTFEEAFKNATNLKEVNLPNLLSTNGDVFKNAFVNSGVEKIDLPKLTTGRVGFYTGCTNAKQLKSFSLSALPEVAIDGYQFHEALKGCSALTAVNFHSLTTDNGLRNSFYCLASDDKSLVSVDFSSLQYATGRESFEYVFSNTGLVSAEFPSLVQIGGQQTFRGALGWCTELTSASFPELTAAANSNAGMQTIMKECPKLLSVYLPKL